MDGNTKKLCTHMFSCLINSYEIQIFKKYLRKLRIMYKKEVLVYAGEWEPLLSRLRVCKMFS